MADAEYQKRQEGSQWVFEVTPASAPKSRWFVIMGGILAFLGLIMGPIGWILFVPLGALGIWFGQFRDGRPAAHRAASRFTVTATTVEANGRTFPKEDIHRLIVKNGMSQETIPNVTFVPKNVGGGMGAVYRTRISMAANGLELETGGKAHLLAGGMDKTTAFGLLHDVSKVLRLEMTPQSVAAG